MAHDVFVSYSSQDKAIADAAVSMLEAAGVRCWIAPRDVIPGSNYMSAIVAAIQDSAIIVLIFSKAANESRHVSREIEQAINKGLTIVPLRTEDAMPDGSLEYALTGTHWLDAINEPMEEHLRRLADAVDTLLKFSRPRGSMRAPNVAEQPTDSPRVSVPIEATESQPPTPREESGSPEAQEIHQPRLDVPPSPDHMQPASARSAIHPSVERRLLLASGARDKLIRLWDPQQGTQIGKPFKGKQTWLFSWAKAVDLAEAPDGRLLLAGGGEDGGIRVWDAVTTEPICREIDGHDRDVNDLAFGTSMDGSIRLASGSDDKTAKVWDPLDATELASFEGHGKRVNSVALGVARDGRTLLVTGSDDKTMRVWDAETGDSVGQPFDDHKSGVGAVALGTAADGHLLAASGCNDKKVRVWDPLTGEMIGSALTDLTDWVQSVGFGLTSEGRLLLAAGGDQKTVYVWDPISGELLHRLVGRRWMRSVSFGTAPDGQLLLAAAGGGKVIFIWDAVSGEQVGQPLAGHQKAINSIAFCQTDFQSGN